MNRPLKIVQYIPTLRLEEGGPARVVLDLAPALASRGHEVTIASWDAPDAPKNWTGAPGLPHARTTPPPRLPGGLLSREARRQLREILRGADAVHLHGMWAISSVQVARIASALGIRYIITPHGMLDDWSMAQKGPKKRLYLRLFGERWLARAGAVHFTARSERDQARRYLARDGVVIPYLHDLAPYHRLPGPGLARERFGALTTGRPALLYLSRVHYKKRPESLIEAGAELKRAGCDVEILIAGPGEGEYLRSLKQLARRRDVGDRVHFLGMVKGDDKLSLYQAADLFVLPTSQENFGLVFFEALLCGTPVVTTPEIDTWRELEASGGAAITPADPPRLAQTIRDLLRDRGALPAMGAAGRAAMLEFLDTGRILDQFEAIYRGEPAPSAPPAEAQAGSAR